MFNFWFGITLWKRALSYALAGPLPAVHDGCAAARPTPHTRRSGDPHMLDRPDRSLGMSVDLRSSPEAASGRTVCSSMHTRPLRRELCRTELAAAVVGRQRPVFTSECSSIELAHRLLTSAVLPVPRSISTGAYRCVPGARPDSRARGHGQARNTIPPPPPLRGRAAEGRAPRAGRGVAQRDLGGIADCCRRVVVKCGAADGGPRGGCEWCWWWCHLL